MAKLRKRPAAIWAAVVWIGGLGVLIGSVIFSTIGVAGASGNATITANQGAAGSVAWPVGVTGALPAGTNTIGNVGIAGSLPSGTNTIGTVNVTAPSRFSHRVECTVPNGSSQCTITGLGIAGVLNTLSVECFVATGQKVEVIFSPANVEITVPLSLQGTFGGRDTFTGVLTNLGLDIPSGEPGDYFFFSDYTASSGNGAACELASIGTTG